MSRKEIQRRKWIYSCLIMLFVGILANGCGRRGIIVEEKNTQLDNGAKGPEEIKQAALEYLQENYSDEFTVTALEGENWSDKFDRIYVESDAYPDEYFQVHRIVKGKEVIFTDNYFTLYMRADAENYFQRLIDAVKNGTSVSAEFTETKRPSNLSADSTFNDYFNNGGSIFFYLTLANPCGFTEKEQMMFLKQLQEREFRATVIFEGGSSGEQKRYVIEENMELRES